MSPKNKQTDRSGEKEDRSAKEDRRPILLDLDGDGVQITEFGKSSQFMTGKDGLQHRSSWAAAGNGVLFFDPDGRNAITEQRQYVFTEWNPTASGDLEALRSVFDTNGDGKLSAADTDFTRFKVLVTIADGSTTAMTLAQLGITEINLTANAVNIQLPDGSTITGQTSFTRANGTTGTVANTTLVAEAEGHRVVEVVVTDANGNRVLTQTGNAADGGVAFKIVTTTSPSGNAVLRLYDDNGDGVTDRVQRIDRVTNGDGSKTETVVNRVGADPATAIIIDRTVTTTSADGKVITINRDLTGGGWFDQREVWTTNADGSRTEVLGELAQDGTVISSRSETVSVSGLVRTEGTDRDGNGTAETVVSHSITVAGNNSRTEVVTVRNGDGTLRASETETVSADGRSTGGIAFTRGHIDQILTNPIYAGRIRHRDKVYAGQHAAIIAPERWQQVQDALTGEAARLRGTGNSAASSPLAGKIFDKTGDRLTPSHAQKSGKRLRYYISRRLVTDLRQAHPDAWRLPAQKIEAGIADVLRAHLAKPALAFALIPDVAATEVAAFNDRLKALVSDCDPTQGAALWAPLLRRADLAQGRIELWLDRKAFAQKLGVPAERLSSDGRHIIAPFRLQRRGVETRIILGDATPRPDVVLARNILTARRWYQAIREGASFSAVAKRDKTTPSRIQQMIGLAFLAPDLLDQIAAGSQPLGLTSEWVKRHDLPGAWQAQRDALALL